MRFKRLHIHGFGKFSNNLPEEQRTFNFNPTGINVIIGRNERGKTTLMEALIDTLFGIPHWRKGLRKPWNNSEVFSSDLDFEINDKQYSIKRNFENHQTELIDVTGGRSITIFSEKANPQGRSLKSRELNIRLEEIGLPNRDVFEQLVFVKKFEMEAGVSDEIRRLITGGGGTNYKAIIDKIKDDYFKLTSFDPWQTRNKENPRELETLKVRKAELESRLSGALAVHREVLEKQEEAVKLQRELEELTEKLSDLEFTEKNMQEGLRLFQKQKELDEKLGLLILERDKIKEKQDELNEIYRQIRSRFKLFDEFEGDVVQLSRDLSRVRKRIVEIQRQSVDQELAVMALEREKAELESELERKYPDLMLVSSNFPEELEEYRRLVSQYKTDFDFYRGKLELIKDLEISLSERFKNCRDDYNELLIELREEEKQALQEIDRLKKIASERSDIEKCIKEIKDTIDKKYGNLKELPDNFSYIVSEYISGRDHRRKKQQELEEAQKKLSSLGGGMSVPIRYLIVFGLLFVSFFTAYLIKDLSTAILTGIAGALAGAVIVLMSIKGKQAQRNMLEGSIKVLKEELKPPVVISAVIRKLNMVDNPEKMLQLWAEYQAQVQKLDKYNERLTGMMTAAEIEKLIKSTWQNISDKKKELGLGDQESIQQVLEEYHTYKQTLEMIKTEKTILKGRFPKISSAEMPPLPPELEDNLRQQKHFKNQFPLEDEQYDLDEIKQDFEDMQVLRGRIRDYETRIAHSRESDPFLKQLQKARTEEAECLMRLAPIVEKFSDDPELIEGQFRQFEKLQKRAEAIQSFLSESRDVEKLTPEINRLVSEKALLTENLKNLKQESPSVVEFVSCSPEEADLKLKKLAEEISRLRIICEEKKEHLNLCKISLGHYAEPAEDPNYLAAQIKALEKDIDRLEMLRDSYMAAVNLLQESVEEFQLTYRQLLEGDITRVFQEIAGSGYEKIELDPNFELCIHSRIRRNIDKQALSSGTSDQLYFAVRLALTERMSQKVVLPFLLDDPFVFFDAKRLGYTRSILEQIARTHQVILFSHNPIYLDWGHVVMDFERTLAHSP